MIIPPFFKSRKGKCYKFLRVENRGTGTFEANFCILESYSHDLGNICIREMRDYEVENFLKIKTFKETTEEEYRSWIVKQKLRGKFKRSY